MAQPRPRGDYPIDTAPDDILTNGYPTTKRSRPAELGSYHRPAVSVLSDCASGAHHDRPFNGDQFVGAGNTRCARVPDTSNHSLLHLFIYTNSFPSMSLHVVVLASRSRRATNCRGKGKYRDGKYVYLCLQIHSNSKMATQPDGARAWCTHNTQCVRTATSRTNSVDPVSARAHVWRGWTVQA